MTDLMTIRPARPVDAPRIRAMHRASLRSLGEGFYPSRLIEKFLDEFDTLDDTLIAEGTCFCIEIGGAIAASAAWTLRPNDLGAHCGDAGQPATRVPTVTIRSVFTDPRFARRGLASAIMHRCETKATEQGGTARLALYATLSGIPLYRRLGYRTGAAVTVLLSGGDTFDALHMTKPVESRPSLMMERDMCPRLRK